MLYRDVSKAFSDVIDGKDLLLLSWSISQVQGS